MSEHTPGPWVADEAEAMVRTNRTGADEQDYICMIADQSNDFGKSWEEIELCGDNRKGEIKANARIIAAAPELLEALKELTTYYNVNCSCPECQRKRGVALDAIVKAEGRA